MRARCSNGSSIRRTRRSHRANRGIADQRHRAAELRDLRGPAFGLASDRLGRHRALRLPAVCRHQRHFLLFVGALAGRRILRTGLASDTVITSVVNIATTFIAIALIDRVGRLAVAARGVGGHGRDARRPCGGLCQRAAQCGSPAQLAGTSGLVALWAANLFVVAFGMSWGPVVWVLLGEKSPNRIRAAALAVAASRNGSPIGSSPRRSQPCKIWGSGSRRSVRGLCGAFVVLRVEVRQREQRP